jgi:hypothetical protein
VCVMRERARSRVCVCVYACMPVCVCVCVYIHTQMCMIEVVLGGLVVIVLAIGPKVRGFKPGQGR